MKPTKNFSFYWLYLLGVTLPLGITVAPLIAAVQGPPMTAEPRQATDVERAFETTVIQSPHTYTIDLKGTIDGTMTRMPISHQAYKQGWQPNRFVRIENLGDTDVVNPWLTVNGKRNWRTLRDIVAQVTPGYKTDAAKARAIWEFVRAHRFHAYTFDGECNDAVKMLNVYGYTLCNNDTAVLGELWKQAGLNTDLARPFGHSTMEVFYNDSYHLMDGDLHTIYLGRDNQRIASEQEIVADHDLIKRTHHYSIGAKEDPLRDEFAASLYARQGKTTIKDRRYTRHKMDFTLRPGESLEWRWDHIGKHYSAGQAGKGKKTDQIKPGHLLDWGQSAYENFRNAKMRYTPDLHSTIARAGMLGADNITPLGQGSFPALQPREPGVPAVVTWRIASAYVMVGGTVHMRIIRATQSDNISIKFSRNGQTWATIWSSGRTGGFQFNLVLDELLSPPRYPQYEYFIRVEMLASDKSSDVGLENIRFDTDLQSSLLGLPELELGSNQIKYVDESPGPSEVKITHNWTERTAWHRPGAVAEPIWPRDGQTVRGTKLTFAWNDSVDIDNDTIVDYHFQLSEHQDMRWVLSSNFDKLTSNTPAGSKEQWTIPYVGLLNPDQDYFWRVRALDEKGVWGPWSKAWRFRCSAPGVPINVKASLSNDNSTIGISWQGNPQGNKPSAYKVYGSDEKGFSISDVEYQTLFGRGFCRNLQEYQARDYIKNERERTTTMPANLATTTVKTTLTVAADNLTFPNANKAFYRIVAVDAKGVESGPSNYAAVVRPFIYTLPPRRAKLGVPYLYHAQAIRSIGQLTSKLYYKVAFWDREDLTFKLVPPLAWLGIDADSGILKGTPGPDDLGRHSIVLEVANNQGTRAQQRFTVTVTP